MFVCDRCLDEMSSSEPEISLAQHLYVFRQNPVMKSTSVSLGAQELEMMHCLLRIRKQMDQEAEVEMMNFV